MLRGVNRQIIEINETENPYFERAIFFVRPDCGEPTEHQLHDVAVDWVTTASPSALRSRKQKTYRVSRTTLWILLSAASTVAAVLGCLLFAR